MASSQQYPKEHLQDLATPVLNLNSVAQVSSVPPQASPPPTQGSNVPPPSPNASLNTPEDAEHFRWLSRSSRGPSYTSYFQYSHLPYCSFEWGDKGYAGCSNHGGELLYLSAPSKKTGLLMVRGHFATSLYASLSRSQINFGGPSTFGLEVSRCMFAYDPNGEVITQDDILKENELSKNKAAKNGSTFTLGRMIERGCFNYRWPVTEYYLDLHENYFDIGMPKRENPGAGHAQNSNSGLRDSSNDGGETGANQNEGSATQQQEQNMISPEGTDAGVGLVQQGQTALPGLGGPGTNIEIGTTEQIQRTPTREVNSRAHGEGDLTQHSQNTSSGQIGSRPHETNALQQPQGIPTPPRQTRTRANVGISIEQQTQNSRIPPGQTGLDANAGSATHQQTLNKSSGETPTKERVGAKDKLEQEEKLQPKHVGTCQMFSCAMGDMFYQVLRIEELREDGAYKMCFPDDSQIVLTMGGPVWFQSFNDGDHGLILGAGVNFRSTAVRQTLERSQGIDSETKEEVIDTNEGEETWRIIYWAENKDEEDEKEKKKSSTDKQKDKENSPPTGRGLEAQLYQFNAELGTYTQLKMVKSKTEADSGPKDDKNEETKLTAYNAVAELKKESHQRGLLGQTKTARSTTFVVVIRLFEGPKRVCPEWPKLHEDWPKLPSSFSKDLYEHIAIDPSHHNATGAMWEGIFLDHRTYGLGSEPVIGLTEFNMIGRTCEKILQVDLIPTTFQDDDEDEDDDPKYFALVSNLFVKSNVDLKALFWKIRFLTKVHRILYYIHSTKPKANMDTKEREKTKRDKSTQTEEKDKGKGIEDEPTIVSTQTEAKGKVKEIEESATAPTNEVQFEAAEQPREQKSREEYQMDRIQKAIEDVVRYLAKAMLEQFSNTPKTPMMPDRHIPGESNNYYVMMTFWYVWQYFTQHFEKLGKDFKFDWQDDPAKRRNRSYLPFLLESHRLPSKNWTFAAPDRDKVKLLQWYHYASLLKLCQAKVLHESWLKLEPGLDNDRIIRLANSAKMVSSGKLSSRVPYVAEDEIFDRLSFLSDELCLENLEPNEVSTVTSLSMKRVRQRDFTRTLNPGWVPPDVEESTSGPWEIHALCHHSRLVVLTKEEKGKQDWRTREHTHTEATDFRERISNFLNAEGTLIPCWERAHAKIRRGWLRSEATSVVGTTLLIILHDIMELADREKSRMKTSDDNILELSMADLAGTITPTIGRSLAKLARTSQAQREDQKQLLLEVLHMGGIMKDQLDAFDRFTNESGLQPPIVWKSFHPPLTYHPPSFFDSLEDKPELYKHAVLGEMSMPLSLPGGIGGVIDRPEELLRNRKDFGKKDLYAIVDEDSTKELISIFDIKATQKAEDEQGFNWTIKECRYNDWKECKDEALREKKIKDSKERFVWALYDNLVDQEVQHRLLTVKPLRIPKKPVNIPKSILNLLVYVLHPESAQCLGDHIRDILNFSRFSCQTGETWVATITLRSWRMHCDEDIVRDDARRDPMCQNSFDDFYLPTNLKQVWENVGEKVPNVNKKTIFRPEVSSIILSTNFFGDFSKCTVVSEFMDREKMLEVTQEARKVWQKFIHQPQTARCLVFFLLLGKMCEVITVCYEEAIDTLSSILKLDSTFTNNADDYPPEYELGVWSLDALYKLQNSLNASVVSLVKARDELSAQILTGPGKRNERLEKMCREYTGKFEDDLMQLTAVNVQLDRRIELNTRNKDATSAILAMRDSRTAISQNGTVQRLTYLTIGYLPIALMAAIFAIPHETNVLYWPSMIDHGRGWFVGAIFIISCFTYTLAIYIGNVLAFLKIPARNKSNKKGNKEKIGPQEPPNLWRGLDFVLNWMKKNWLEGSFRENDKEWEARKEKEAREAKLKPKDPLDLSLKAIERSFDWIKENWFKGDFREVDQEREARAPELRKATETEPESIDSAVEVGLDESEVKLIPVKWMKEHWLKGDFRENEVEKKARLEREARELKSKRNNELNAAEQGESSGVRWVKGTWLRGDFRENEVEKKARLEREAREVEAEKAKLREKEARDAEKRQAREPKSKPKGLPNTNMQGEGEGKSGSGSSTASNGLLPVNREGAENAEGN